MLRRLTVPAVATLLLGCVCAAQNRPEIMGPQAQRPTSQPVTQKSYVPTQTPTRVGSPSQPQATSRGQAATAANSAAGQAATGTPRALLPPRPPKVSYNNGMLGIVAENSTLADVLTAVRQKTGATIEAPPSTASERVVISIGPAPANAVLTALLNGSRFDYIILGSQQASGVPQRLILREKQKESPQGPQQGNTQAQVASPPQLPAEAPQPEEEYIPEAEMPDDVQPEPQPETQPGAAGQPGQQQPGQPQVKTPEQLLEELKLMQQQQQQQLQQQQQGQQPGSQPQQEGEPNSRPQTEDQQQQQQQIQPQPMPPDGEAPDRTE